LLARVRPDLADPIGAIERGAVWVDGTPVTNPRSFVRIDAAITVRDAPVLRGETKLAAALAAFGVDVRDRVALDLGAAAGGFTRALLAAGARRVYAVDAGHGQLRGALRQDARVVNLEATNLAALDRARVPDAVDVVTVDLSYLAVADALAELDRIALAPAADLVALVKPMFELGLATAPSDDATVARAVAHAVAGARACGWRGIATMPSPVRGARGAVEAFLHARAAP